MKELIIDPNRTDLPETGIFVRAKNTAGEWDSIDIAHLTRESLFDWLRSRGGDNPWAENTVAILLGHEIEEPPFRTRKR
jgi:hypothetical protein